MDKIKVGFQGKNGTFSEEATKKYFKNENIKNYSFTDFKSIFKALENKELDYALVPVENSTTGLINRTYDLLLEYNLWICGETYLPIKEYLIGTKDATLTDIKEIYSHPEALLQCSEFLSKYPWIKVISYQDTASSVQYITTLQDKTKAALASVVALDYYPGKVIEANVNNNVLNTTRFFCLTRNKQKQKTNKISVYLTLKHQAGSLAKILSIFATYQVNLTNIVSKPLPNTLFEYGFYIDFIGDINSENIAMLNKELSKHTESYQILGAYLKEDNYGITSK